LVEHAQNLVEHAQNYFNTTSTRTNLHAFFSGLLAPSPYIKALHPKGGISFHSTELSQEGDCAEILLPLVLDRGDRFNKYEER